MGGWCGKNYQSGNSKYMISQTDFGAPNQISELNTNQTRFVAFESPCPACPNDTKLRKWTHNNCGGSMEINCKARLRCTLHRASEESILYWRFSCDNHAGVYKEPNIWGLSYAISVMSSVASQSDKEFGNMLLQTLQNELIPSMTNN